MREIPMPAEILKILESQPDRIFRLRDLVVELELRSSQARELRQVLRQLAREGRIRALKKGHYALLPKPRAETKAAGGLGAASRKRDATSQRTNVIRGRLSGHRDGYGFVVPDERLDDSAPDIFIPAVSIGSAMHGDHVEAQIVSRKHNGRLEGRIVRVLARAQQTVVGEFRLGHRHNYVVPFDQRLPQEIIIPRGREFPTGQVATDSRDRQFGGKSEGKRAEAGRIARSPQDLNGLVVDVALTDFPSAASPPRGRVIEVLGRREDFGVDVEIIIRKYHLPHRFPAEALAEAEGTPQYIPEADRIGRRDFRHFPIVTIDGETAKDFDDAVYVERLPGGNYLLHVHIADVAHYVRPGMALDREARLRGTSVYFPDRAVPMLPLELSNGICSLNPRVDRLVMSVLMEVDGAGHIVEYELLPGLIRSAERMTYTAVQAILAGDPTTCRRYQDLFEHFRLMEELARILNRRREQRGSIDFDLPEPEIEFDEHGRMIGITRAERNIAHRIIEEFMLAANETVAGYLEAGDVPSLYRIHEKPDTQKVIEFEEIAASFGYSLGIELPPARRTRIRFRDRRERYPRFHEEIRGRDLAITSRHYQQLTKRLEGKPEERILSYLMLRSLKQARYSEENQGHFALAAPTYTHFTSPIRRYPDLIVHRILKAVLTQEGGSVRWKSTEPHGQRLTRQRALEAPRLGDRRPPSRRATLLTVSSPAPSAALPGGALLGKPELEALGVETSEAERRAAEAERELMEWKKVAFMGERLGEEFDALIISLTKYGFFVELVDLFVEGLVPLESLDDDCYIYRERLRAVIGVHTQRSYQLGDRLRVRLDRIDRVSNRLEFSVVS